MSQPHRNQPGELPRSSIVLRQDRRIVGRMSEHPNARNLPFRVVPNWCARAYETLPDVLALLRPKSDDLRAGVLDVARLDQSQAAQPPRGLDLIKVQSAMPWHLLAVGGVHRHLVRPGAPHIRHLAGGGCRDETVGTRPQRVLPKHRVRVQLELGTSQLPETKIEDLERQAIPRRVIVLTCVPTTLEHSQEAMNRRGWKLESPRQLSQAQSLDMGAECFANSQRLVYGSRTAGCVRCLPHRIFIFHNVEQCFSLPAASIHWAPGLRKELQSAGICAPNLMRRSLFHQVATRAPRSSSAPLTVEDNPGCQSRLERCRSASAPPDARRAHHRRQPLLRVPSCNDRRWARTRFLARTSP